MFEKLTPTFRSQTESVVAAQKLMTEWMLQQHAVVAKQVEAVMDASKASFDASRAAATGLQEVWTQAMPSTEAKA